MKRNRLFPAAALVAIALCPATAFPDPCSFTRVAVGFHHSCAIADDKSVVCWGRNRFGGSMPPEGEFVDIAAGGRAFASPGSNHACALRTDGSIACWGYSESPPPQLPDGTFVQISADEMSTCALHEDGSARCWTDHDLDSDYYAFDSPGPYMQISAGWHGGGCGIRQDGSVSCWGFGDSGFEPVSELPFVQIEAEDDSACGVRSDGSLMCWGEGVFVLPEHVPGGSYEQVSIGSNYGCALRSDGEIVCWSDSNFEDYGAASPPDGPFTEVRAGTITTCGRRSDGQIECWGYNRYGAATAPSRLGAYRSIAVAGTHACSLREDGKAVCWGEDFDYAPLSEDRLVEVVAAYTYSCAITEKREMVCRDTPYQIGDIRPLPEHVFETVDFHGGLACSIDVAGQLDCWGDSPLASAATPPGDFADVSTHPLQSCALRSDGTIVCWSPTATWTPLSGAYRQMDFSGAYGCALAEDASVSCWLSNGSPDLSIHDGDYRTLAVGHTHACALTSDDALECWGPNHNEQVAPLPPGIFVDVAAGNDSSCALSEDGTAYCWGSIGPSANPSCRRSALCGDRVVSDGEGCDDGEQAYVAGHRCTPDCERVGCGRPLHPEAALPGASDALFMLTTAVGGGDCDIAVCDTNGDGRVLVSDALQTLRRAVGISVAESCPEIRFPGSPTAS